MTNQQREARPEELLMLQFLIRKHWSSPETRDRECPGCGQMGGHADECYITAVQSAAEEEGWSPDMSRGVWSGWLERAMEILEQ